MYTAFDVKQWCQRCHSYSAIVVAIEIYPNNSRFCCCYGDPNNSRFYNGNDQMSSLLLSRKISIFSRSDLITISFDMAFYNAKIRETIVQSLVP